VNRIPFLDFPLQLVGDLANQANNPSPLISTRFMVLQEFVETGFNFLPNGAFVFYNVFGIDAGDIAFVKARQFVLIEAFFQLYQEISRMRSFHNKSKNDGFVMMFEISENLFQSISEEATPTKSVDSKVDALLSYKGGLDQ
jgi:hypothetical protein